MLGFLEMDPILLNALREDIRSGDITTESVIPPGLMGRAEIRAKEKGILCGLPVAARAFALVEPEVRCDVLLPEGAELSPGDTPMRMSGPVRGILIGERVVLNFLQRLSGIATKTARFVRLVEGYPVRIVDTRKTTPGLRLLEKYAVRVGGGQNHRFALDDGVLLKDNHLAAAGSIHEAVRQARLRAPHTMKIEVEVETLEQLREALDAGADIVLLDNMDADTMARAVSQTAGRALLEASGGINEETAREIAATGVDILSIGGLTHSARALDLSLEIIG
ncbi:MAG: carboxylating nicotinate-nucleotide diphosphorylase [Armatimonadetes bacterium]|nr:carboxylating nicotinate-nucleotide diphosphorylase [Armatimonadota bacterium]